MNLHNGSTSAPPNGVAQGMGDLTHDIVSLAELQYELVRNDYRAGMKGLLVPVVLLLVAGIVALGTVPIALLLMAEILIQVAGLSRVIGPFDRGAERLHRGGGPGSCGVVPAPRSRACFSAFPGRMDPQFELDQARFEAVATDRITAT